VIDRYTKVVLTIIAGCLLWLCVMNGGRAVEARQLTPMGSLPGGVQPVVIVGWGSMDQQGKVSLRFVTDNSVRRTDATLPVRADSPLSVKLQYSDENPLPAKVFSSAENPLAVQISSIRKNADAWDPVRTQVEPAPWRDKPGGGR
jgi:hypothetical protein